LGQKYCNTRINFTDRERDQHAGVVGGIVDDRMENCLAKARREAGRIVTFFGKVVDYCIA
jgi:hypothetical protein